MNAPLRLTITLVPCPSRPSDAEARRLAARRDDLAQRIRQAGRDHRASNRLAEQAKAVTNEILTWGAR